VIFDFDGTVADSFAATLAIANRLAPEFGYRAAAAGEIEQLRDSSYSEVARVLGVKMHKVPLVAARVRKELSRDIEQLRPAPGLPAALGALRQRGLALGVFSSNSKRNVERFLRANHLDCFDFVSTASNVWGKQSHLRSLLKRRGIATGEALYVGDETRDIDACHALGVRVVAVTWGYTSAKRLQAHDPSFLIDEPGQLLAIAAGETSSAP
jgi:phosphoglycolate phosphatase-like HAD superfamily hydrolase